MKVLKPQEVKNSRQLEIERDLSKIDSTKKALEEVTTELENTEARFEIALANQRIRWSREEQESTDRIQNLELEVKKLSKQREVLLMPIELVKEKADNMFKEAEQALLEANKLKDHNNDLQILLQDKIDTYTTLQTDLNLRDQKTKIKEEALEKQSEISRNLSQELSKKWEEYFLSNDEKLKEFMLKEKELEFERLSIKAEKDSIDRQKKDLSDMRLLVASERAALQAASQNINVKHSSI
jgi:hypothetical protein